MDSRKAFLRFFATDENQIDTDKKKYDVWRHTVPGSGRRYPDGLEECAPQMLIWLRLRRAVFCVANLSSILLQEIQEQRTLQGLFFDRIYKMNKMGCLSLARGAAMVSIGGFNSHPENPGIPFAVMCFSAL